jgi:hypothetical protein
MDSARFAVINDTAMRRVCMYFMVVNEVLITLCRMGCISAGRQVMQYLFLI